MLDPVQVSFASNWDPNRGSRSQAGRLNADDMAAIQAGWRTCSGKPSARNSPRRLPAVKEAGPDTLRVTAAVVDLYITAPDTCRQVARAPTRQLGTHDPGGRIARFDDR